MLGTDAYSSSMHMMDDLLRGRNARSLLMGAESMRLMDEAISLQLNRPNLFYPSLREMDMLRATDSFAARFRLPAKTEVARLMVEFAEIHSETLARCAPPEGGLKQAIEGMRTPWLDIQLEMRSVAGLAQMQGIGYALRSMPAFDEGLSAALRQNLGDWRDAISWRPEIFTDLAARSDFYATLGFNSALTDFPQPAFDQALDIAGLRAEEYEPLPRATADDEEEGLMRTNAAHDRLQRMERLLRRFVDQQMTLRFGPGWPQHRLPNGLYEKWCDRKRKAEEAGAEERSVIEYADFTDYELVICRADNWREVFVETFNRQESVRESFQRLHPIRLDTMHARLITLDDELLLYVEIKRLMKGDQEATQLTSRRAQCKTGSSPASHRAHVEALA